MRRWLTTALVLVVGCSEGQLNDAGMDAGAQDAGPTLAQRQVRALSEWGVDMARGERAMLSYIDRNFAMFDGDRVAEFRAAARAFRELNPTPPDAGRDEMLAFGISYAFTVRGPAYCRVIAAYLAATAMAFPEPRVRCSELPTPPDGWWTRWE